MANSVKKHINLTGSSSYASPKKRRKSTKKAKARVSYGQKGASFSKTAKSGKHPRSTRRGR